MNRRLPGLLLPPTLWLLAFLVVPTLLVTASAISAEGLRTLAAPATFLLLGRSLRIATITTALCLAIAYPAALFIAGCRPKTRNLLLFLVVLPFWTNLLVRTYALMFVLRPIGLLYNEGSVIFGLVHSYLPFMILPLYASLEKVPARLLEASRDLGASRWQTFWKVTVPLTLPGIAAGCILVFIPVLGAFATPELMGGAGVPMVGNQINLYFVKARNAAAGSALTLVLMLATILLTWAYHRTRRTEGLL